MIKSGFIELFGGILLFVPGIVNLFITCLNFIIIPKLTNFIIFAIWFIVLDLDLILIFKGIVKYYLHLKEINNEH